MAAAPLTNILGHCVTYTRMHDGQAAPIVASIYSSFVLGPNSFSSY